MNWTCFLVQYNSFQFICSASPKQMSIHIQLRRMKICSRLDQISSINPKAASIIYFKSLTWIILIMLPKPVAESCQSNVSVL